MTTSQYKIGDRIEITGSSSLIGKTAFVRGFSKKGWLQLEAEEKPNSKITISPDHVKICPLDKNTSEQTIYGKVNSDGCDQEVEVEEHQELPVTHDSTPDKPLLPPDEENRTPASAISPYFKFTCTRGLLADALSRVVRVIKPMPIHPVLANVKIHATRDGNVELTAFDLRMGIVTDFEASVNREGTFTLDCRVLYALVLLFPAGEVTLEVMKDKYPIVEITTSVGTYSLSGIAADEFPEILFPGANAQRLALSTKQLAIGLASTLYATSTDETKQVLTGAHFVFDGTNNLEMASTDGHRLTRFRYLPATAKGEQDRFTIPGSTLREVERFLSKEDKDVYISYDSIAENNLSSTIVKFVAGHTTVVSRILEGQYPVYDKLIPTNFATEVWMDRANFIAAVKRIALVSEQKNYFVKICFSLVDQKITISAENESSSGTETLSAQITGEAIDVGFNIKYLSDAIASLGSKEFAMKLNTPTGPVVCEPLNGNNVLALIMPLQMKK